MLIAARAWSALCILLALIAASKPAYDLAGIVLVAAAIPWGVIWVSRGSLR
jgi:hypothetical protein